MGQQNPLCRDKRKCFARAKNNRCKILSVADYEDGECPFRKENFKDADGKGKESEETMTKKCYISGLMQGETEERIQEKFAEAEQEVRKLGFEPINPALLPKIYPGFLRYQYLMIDLMTVSVCDVIYMLRDYKQSGGAKKELKMAKKKDLTVIYQPGEENNK